MICFSSHRGWHLWVPWFSCLCAHKGFTTFPRKHSAAAVQERELATFHQLPHTIHQLAERGTGTSMLWFPAPLCPSQRSAARRLSSSSWLGAAPVSESQFGQSDRLFAQISAKDILGQHFFQAECCSRNTLLTPSPLECIIYLRFLSKSNTD